MFKPRIFEALRGYNLATAKADVAAGVVVGVVALPLCIAFALASGLGPAQGLITGIVAGALISLLGGSHLQIGGPTGAFVVIVYGIYLSYGWANLLVCTMLAGLMMFALGALRLGSLIRYLPLSLLHGFTLGLGVVIALSQVKDALALPVAQVPAEFFAKVWVLAQHLHSANVQALGMSTLGVLLLVLWPQRLKALVPAPIVWVVLATLGAHWLGLDLPTIGSRFSLSELALPTPAWPEIHLSTLGALLSPALAIAALGAIESLLSARAVDRYSPKPHDPNQELMAQGLANFITPLFGGIPATGAIARTSTNVEAGGRTPVAGVVHALVLLLVVLLAMPLAAYIPLAALSSILLVTAWKLAEVHHLANLLRQPGRDIAVFSTAALLTVVFDLAIAVELGVLLACLLFVRHAAGLVAAHKLTEPDLGPDVALYRIEGLLFFGSAEALEQHLAPLAAHPGPVVLDLSGVLSADQSALALLGQWLAQRQSSAQLTLLVGTRAELRQQCLSAGFDHEQLRWCEDFSQAQRHLQHPQPVVISAAPSPQPVPLNTPSQWLRQLLHQAIWPLNLEQLSHKLAEGGFALSLGLLALANALSAALPWLSPLWGLLVLGLALQMLAGRASVLVLPSVLARWQVSEKLWQWLMLVLEPVLQLSQRFGRSGRWLLLAPRHAVRCGGAVALLAAALMLQTLLYQPLLASAVLLLAALGFLIRDGLLVSLGALLGVIGWVRVV